MLQRKTVEITVGFFIIIGVLSMLMLALKVSGLNDIYNDNSGYKIKAEFENIGGLKVKAKVSVGGVVVGRVTSIDLDNESYIANVIIQLNKNINNLPADTRASILTAGLLGDNYIGLVPGFDEQFLTDNSTIPLENTRSAVVLEDLISKFVANQAQNQAEASSQ